MSHLLLLDVPGGNDFTVLEDAVQMGHEVTFYTSNVEHYRRQGYITQSSLVLAREIVEISPFSYTEFEQSALLINESLPFDAILCLIDIRMVEASRLANKLGLKFLNPETAILMRDKVRVRERLASQGIRQPRFASAQNADELKLAVSRIGFPVLIKPADGYASQNVSVLNSESELNDYLEVFGNFSQFPTDYGLGVYAGSRFSVEQYIQGEMIGCDIFSNEQERVFLGINHKVMFPPPSFSMRGSCFPSASFDQDEIRTYANEILDAVIFDFGAAHIEMIVTNDGPYLVEVNPRLVSAQIPYQMGYAFERSLYADLINLHLGFPLDSLAHAEPKWSSVIRWITASRDGVLHSIHLPTQTEESVRRVVLFKEPGDIVRPPISNGDRIGYVIAVGTSQEAAESVAESYVRETRVVFQ